MIINWFRIGFYAAAVAAVVGAYAYWHHKVYQSGVDDTIAAIAAKNQGALDAVRKATKNVDDCHDAGGEWDTSVGVCHDR